MKKSSGVICLFVLLATNLLRTNMLRVIREVNYISNNCIGMNSSEQVEASRIVIVVGLIGVLASKY